MPEPPVVGLVAREARAVDAGLLAGPEADDGPVQGVADRVGLRVLEGDRRDEEVELGLRGELTTQTTDQRMRRVRGMPDSDGKGKRKGKEADLLVLGDDVVEEGGLDLDVVALLLERDAVHLSGLDVSRDVLRVHLRPRNQSKEACQTDSPQKKEIVG